MVSGFVVVVVVVQKNQNWIFYLCQFYRNNSRMQASFNPLRPDIKIHNFILLTVFHTFLMELVRRIGLNIKTSSPC